MYRMSQFVSIVVDENEEVALLEESPKQPKIALKTEAAKKELLKKAIKMDQAKEEKKERLYCY